MFRSAHIQVNVLPIFVSLLAHQCLVVVGVHIPQVVGRRARKPRHGVQFEREHTAMVNQCLVNNFFLFDIPCPQFGVAQWRLSAFSGFIFADFGQLQWQFVFGHHIGHAVFIIHGEWFAPVALSGEDGIAQTEVHLDTPQLVGGDKLLGLLYRLFHRKTVERESVKGVLAGSRTVGHCALLGIKALLAHVASLDERHDGQVEMLGKGIVARVVGRHGHDGPCAISGQHIF